MLAATDESCWFLVVEVGGGCPQPVVALLYLLEVLVGVVAKEFLDAGGAVAVAVAIPGAGSSAELPSALVVAALTKLTLG